jgi:hypothetical protein
LEEHRSRYVQQGGKILPSAACVQDPNELSAIQVLLVPLIALLCGMMPGKFLPRTTPSVVAMLLLIALGFLTLGYSVLHWSWPPVGFEASGFVAFLSLVATGLCILAAIGVSLVRLVRRGEVSSASTSSARNEG